MTAGFEVAGRSIGWGSLLIPIGIAALGGVMLFRDGVTRTTLLRGGVEVPTKLFAGLFFLAAAFLAIALPLADYYGPH